MSDDAHAEPAAGPPSDPALDAARAAIGRGQYAQALDLLGALLGQRAHGRGALALTASLIELPHAPTAERLRAGELAGRYGDVRPGVCGLPPAMVDLPGGDLRYGNTPDEYEAIVAAERRNGLEQEASDWYESSVSDSPALVAPFALARYPVTNAQWALFMAAGGYDPGAPWWDAAGRLWLQRERRGQPSHWDDERLGHRRANAPVVGVSWYEATALCRWLTERLADGFTYALPSELEWEYAARGSARRAYPWGDAPPSGERANYDSAHQGTTAVGCFPAGASPEGLLDLMGNVSEWTRSAYRPYPYDPGDGRERAAAPQEERFTLRGGGWRNQPVFLRASLRSGFTPRYHYATVGVRLARHRPAPGA